MSDIKHKGPHVRRPLQFEPLNTRKTGNTVGKTFGERRETDRVPQDPGPLKKAFESIRDRFSGSKKRADLAGFQHRDDRFEMGTKAYSARGVVVKKNIVESGNSIRSRVKQAPQNQYVGFLNSVITFLDARKIPKKV